MKKILIASVLSLALFNTSCSSILHATDWVGEKKILDKKTEEKKDFQKTEVIPVLSIQNDNIRLDLKINDFYKLNVQETTFAKKDNGILFNILAPVGSFLIASGITFGIFKISNNLGPSSPYLIAEYSSGLGIAVLDFILAASVFSNSSEIRNLPVQETVQENIPANESITLILGEKKLTGVSDIKGTAYFYLIPKDDYSSVETANIQFNYNGKTLNKPIQLTPEFRSALASYSLIQKSAIKPDDITNNTIQPTQTGVKVSEKPEIIILQPEATERGIKIVEKNKSTELVGFVKSKTEITDFRVNGKKYTLSKNGGFKVNLPLEPGDNDVFISVTDQNDNKEDKAFIISRKIAEEAPEEKIAKSASTDLKITGKYYSLIIGINNYKKVASLKTAVNDAVALEKVLKNSYGFETKLLLNEKASRDNIIKELNSYRKKLFPNDKLLIYYAGHGFFDPNTDTSYWLPVDAEQDDNTFWIISDSITSNLKSISAKQVLIVADSCYSGTLTREAVTSFSSNDTRNNYIKKILEKDARVLISSGGNEPVADSGNSGHSVFANAFINSLKNIPQKIFTSEELFINYVKEPVAGKSDQTPEYKVIKNSGHDGGDFVFIKKIQL